MRWIWVILSVTIVSEACLLCNLRVPPRPRPLDQFQLPRIPKIPSAETMPAFCNMTDTLPVDGECRDGFRHLLCSAEKLGSAFVGGCPGPEDPEKCSQCTYDKKNNFWVVSWFDSLGKPPAGISDGNYYWLGDYEICHELRATKTFSGQYCRVELEVPDAQVEAGCPQTDPLQIILGVCFPSQCSTQELAKVTEEFSPYKLSLDCELPIEWSIGAKIFLAFTALWMFIILVATLLHIRNPDVPLLIYCLSLKINGARALSTKRDYDLHAHQGLEFITFFMLTTAMVYSYMLPYIENVAFAFDQVSSASMHIVNNYSYHVDGLLSLSALFTTSLLFSHITGVKDIFSAIFRKLVRFWPGYLFIIGFMAFVFTSIASGPMWIHGDMNARCATSWWKNLLLVNNFFGAHNTCLDFGYVISLEAQYFVLLVVLICIAYKRRVVAQVIATILLVTSIVMTFLRVYNGQLPPTPMLTAEPVKLDKLLSLLDTVMVPSITRLSPYMVGFLYYFFFNFDEFDFEQQSAEGSRTDSKTNRAKSVVAFAMFGIALIMMGTVMFFLLPYASSNRGSQISFALYASLHRPAWAFGLITILWLCQHKSFKELNSFLSWRLFSPLSKLTYQALLLAEPMILYIFSALNRPGHATHWSTLYAAVSTTAVSYMCALLIDIFLSRPLRNILYSRSIHRRRHTIPVHQDLTSLRAHKLIR